MNGKKKQEQKQKQKNHDKRVSSSVGQFHEIPVIPMETLDSIRVHWTSSDSDGEHFPRLPST